MSTTTVLIPDLLYRDDAFHAGLALEYDAHTGRITRIADRFELEGAGAIPLPGRALMPGFVNVHSHAFQRIIRGRTHWRPTDESVSDFWTWRDAMYRAALSLSPDDIYAVSRFCFIEMLRAGITTVGEFHYLHNDEAGRPYGDRNELAQRVIAAAVDVGLRVCLLNTCYATGGISQPLRPEQRRFATTDLDEYLAATESLAAVNVGSPLVTVGVAPHSLRAVPREWVRTLHAWAATRDLPLHMHVAEQPAEVDACLALYGLRPVALLAEDMVLDDRFTAVHATHIDDADIALLAASTATVCACPTTERDLGDGMVRAADLLRAGVQIAVGSDSQTVISMLEEVRQAEYVERLRRLERVILTRRGIAALEVAPVLLEMATSAGARALRLSAGVLEEGALADFVAIDLGHHTLAGWSVESLPSAIALCAPADIVSDVWVGGRPVIASRSHAVYDAAAHEFRAVARRFGALT
ncbi:MAG TPA: formimidoylglutamate deiminase [Longimicrobiales bacterium]|nr:formimidoylglutamate deiminase [Longimicrobiales bacterium]